MITQIKKLNLTDTFLDKDSATLLQIQDIINKDYEKYSHNIQKLLDAYKQNPNLLDTIFYSKELNTDLDGVFSLAGKYSLFGRQYNDLYFVSEIEEMEMFKLNNNLFSFLLNNYHQEELLIDDIIQNQLKFYVFDNKYYVIATTNEKSPFFKPLSYYQDKYQDIDNTNICDLKDIDFLKTMVSNALGKQSIDITPIFQQNHFLEKLQQNIENWNDNIELLEESLSTNENDLTYQATLKNFLDLAFNNPNYVGNIININNSYLIKNTLTLSKLMKDVSLALQDDGSMNLLKLSDNNNEYIALSPPYTSHVLESRDLFEISASRAFENLNIKNFDWDNFKIELINLVDINMEKKISRKSSLNC